MTAAPEPSPASGYVSPLLGVEGAVAGPAPDSGVAWHYGNPLGEQRLLDAGAALVDLSHRGVLRVSGPDRLTWLHSLTTQHLSGLRPGESTEALVLSPHGHVEHAMHVVDDGTATWLGVEPGTSQALASWLDRMRFLLRVDVDDVGATWAVLAGCGPGGPDASVQHPSAPGPPADLRRAGEPPPWRDPWPTVGVGSTSYAASPEDEHPSWSYWEVLVPRRELTSRVGTLPLAGTWALEALRIAAWRPRLGRESDHRTIPHEVDWLRTAVHLTKGCYRGQESVARVHNLGRPPRRLVLLHLDGSGHTLPEPGTPVRLGERTVGHLTSVSLHYELGPIALAMVKRNTPVSATLLTALTLGGGDVSAAQEVVVRP